jgi:hypothetical protein
MDAEKNHRALLSLLVMREIEPLLDATLQLAMDATGAATAVVEIPRGPFGDIRRLAGKPLAPEVENATVRAEFAVDGARGTLLVQLDAAAHRPATGLDLLAELLGLVLERIARTEQRLPLAEEIRALRERRILQALMRNGWNVAAAARDLDVARSHVYDVTEAIRQRRHDV